MAAAAATPVPAHVSTASSLCTDLSKLVPNLPEGEVASEEIEKNQKAADRIRGSFGAVVYICRAPHSYRIRIPTELGMVWTERKKGKDSEELRLSGSSHLYVSEAAAVHLNRFARDFGTEINLPLQPCVVYSDAMSESGDARADFHVTIGNGLQIYAISSEGTMSQVTAEDMQGIRGIPAYAVLSLYGISYSRNGPIYRLKWYLNELAVRDSDYQTAVANKRPANNLGDLSYASFDFNLSASTRAAKKAKESEPAANGEARSRKRARVASIADAEGDENDVSTARALAVDAAIFDEEPDEA